MQLVSWWQWCWWPTVGLIVMLGTICGCWWILVSDANVKKYWMLVTKMPKPLPTSYFVCNIRHQHRCNPWLMVHEPTELILFVHMMACLKGESLHESSKFCVGMKKRRGIFHAWFFFSRHNVIIPIGWTRTVIVHGRFTRWTSPKIAHKRWLTNTSRSFT